LLAISSKIISRHINGDANARDYDTLPLVSALNLVLQQHANRTGVRVGKNRYFFPSAEKFKLGPRVEAWQGFFASVRPTYKELMVNVYVSYLFSFTPCHLILHISNVCMTAFVQPGNLADALNEFAGNSRGAMPNLPNSMKRIRIRTLHLGYKKAIYRVGTTSARNTKFLCEELGGTVSVEQYFAKSVSLNIRLTVAILNSKIFRIRYQAQVSYGPPRHRYRK
jgi:eukaryotic translation initiation factor 2C